MEVSPVSTEGSARSEAMLAEILKQGLECAGASRGVIAEYAPAGGDYRVRAQIGYADPATAGSFPLPPGVLDSLFLGRLARA